MSEFSLLVQEYYKNPVNNYRMEDAMVFRHEGNSICGDDITVYFTYDDEHAITARSYDGNVSMVTQASASFFSEIVVWKTFSEILAMNETFMIDAWFDVSHRRRRARVIPLLATRNAIHELLKDWITDTFDDLLVGE